MRLKVPLKRQTKPTTCGAACLEMVFKYYGVDISEDDIASETMILSPETGRKYIRTAHLVHFAVTRGFSAFHSYMTNKGELQKLINLEMPVIVLQRHTPDNESLAHFRVVTGVQNEVFVLNDPEMDFEKTVWKEEFNKLWKRQPAGENVQENLFILIYPRDKKVDHQDFTFDPLQFRKCTNPNCTDPLQERVPFFQCFFCNTQFLHDQIGIPFGCPNLQCSQKYWLTYLCNSCGSKTWI